MGKTQPSENRFQSLFYHLIVYFKEVCTEIMIQILVNSLRYSLLVGDATTTKLDRTMK